jgi:16S rRNA (cytidine1402-2'-O)-methyltransferase
MQGKLFVVATPIGNLEDITIRALNVLKEVDLIAAEDTRHTLGLLNHFEIKKPLFSYYKEVENEKADTLIKKLQEGQNIALVSDAGTPGISDPGHVVIKKCIENNIEVVPIPGAVAFVNALIASGLDTNKFEFVGFLSANKTEKKKELEKIKYNTNTLIFYEAPHKLESTIEIMKDVFEEDRQIVLAKELTKIHEQFIRCKLSTISEQNVEFKGEFVILLEGSKISKDEKQIQDLSELSLEEHYKYYEEQGMNKKDIIKQMAKDRNVNKNEIYQKFI